MFNSRFLVFLRSILNCVPTHTGQGQASPPVTQKHKKISVTAPPKINGNSKTETPETRNGSSAGADERVLRKHPVLTPTDHRANPLATVSNISTDNRLSKLRVVTRRCFVLLSLAASITALTLPCLCFQHFFRLAHSYTLIS